MDCICHFHRKRAFRETVALAELNALFNMDENGDDAIDMDDEVAEPTSLQEKLAAMKARVSETLAGRDAADKTKGKEEVI